MSLVNIQSEIVPNMSNGAIQENHLFQTELRWNLNLYVLFLPSNHYLFMEGRGMNIPGCMVPFSCLLSPFFLKDCLKTDLQNGVEKDRQSSLSSAD